MAFESLRGGKGATGPFLAMLVALPALSFGQAGVPSRVARYRLYVIRSQAIEKGVFPPGDREFVLKALDDRDLAVSHIASLALIMAAKARLFPQARLMGLLVRKASTSDGFSAELFVGECARALSLPWKPSASEKARALAIQAKGKPTDRLDPEERGFLRQATVPYAWGRSLPMCDLLVRKRLAGPDKREALGAIDRCVRASEGPERVFWRYFRDVIAKR